MRNLINVAVALTMVLFALTFRSQIGLIAGAFARPKNEFSAVLAIPHLPFQRFEPIY